MSLDFDFKNVKNSEVVTTHPGDDEKWHPVSNALVWFSLSCGFNQITEANKDEVASRIAVYQKAFSPSIAYGSPFSRVYVTAADVEAHVGMVTNAPKLNTAAFNKRVIEHLTRDAEPIKDGRYNVLEGPMGFIVDRKRASGAEVVAAAAKHFSEDK